ncbi:MULTISPECIES: Ig-like domain-containing protein [unclassified Fusibacter]|uniref:Ig-like domain-containing protein n=1 Tax=unclassified Fusibacter TaxID=2624464 RepID=UPI0013E9363E|nr:MULTISPECIES: Ig-like domain-containing protein [unclassified Fusibacter]MCK8060106.1 Ig-like domain-containing protein [Fusibacter sp. A2]NPE22248.1 hypothetical protein [Fusibacter sp. A1]
MRSRKRVRRISLLMALLLVFVSLNSLSFGAKKIKDPPTPPEPTSNEIDLQQVAPGETVTHDFSIKADYNDPSLIVMTPTSEDGHLVLLSESIKTNGKNKSKTANYKFTTTAPGTYLYTVEASVSGEVLITEDYIFNVLPPASPPADTEPPFVFSTEPANNDIGVLKASDVLITFDDTIKVMDNALITVTANDIGIDFSKPENGLEAISLTLSLNLEYDTVYAVSLATGAIEDLAGNPLAPYSFSFATETEPVEPPAPETINYLALGDSVPYGTTYDTTDDSDPAYSGVDGIGEYSYVDKVAYTLAGDGKMVNVTNLSVEGWVANDVLLQLQNDEIVREMIRNADVMSLCVGANNIMDAAPRNFFGIIDFYDIDWTLANQGRGDFENDWSRIISEIEAIVSGINEDIVLEVMTIYNPYDGDDNDAYNKETSLFNETLIHDEADHYFSDSVLDGNRFNGLNTIIKNTTTVLDYRVVDVYQYFEDYYANDKKAVTGFYNFFDDPHPDKNGQDIIGDLHLDAFNGVQNDYVMY